MAAKHDTIILAIAAAATPAAITACVWAVRQPTPATIVIAAALNSIALIAWALYRVGLAETRIIARIAQVERAHSVRIFDDAVAPNDQPGAT